MLEIRRVSNDVASDVLKTSWRLLKRDYPLMLGTSAFLVAVALAVSKIPYLKFLLALPFTFLTISQMWIIRERVAGRAATFTDVFRAFREPSWIERLLPLAIAGVAVALLQEAIASSASGVVGTLFAVNLSLLISLVWLALAAFSGPLIIFGGVSFKNSIELNLKVVGKNWVPLLIYTFFAIGLALLSLIALVLPFFFIFIPMFMMANYFWYVALFENADLAAIRASIGDEETGN